MSERILVADENLHQSIVNSLRSSGFTVMSIRETSPGMSDTSVLEVASKAHGVLITEDSDFGELVFSHRLRSIGVLYLRYSPSEVEEIIRSLLVVLRDYTVFGNFCTVTLLSSWLNSSPDPLDPQPLNRFVTGHNGKPRNQALSRNHPVKRILVRPL